MTDLNIASNGLGVKADGSEYDMSGVIAISNAIPTMGAMVTVNVMGNEIGEEQLSKLQDMMQAHPTLLSLCGIAAHATKANLSGLGMDDDDAVVLANELPAKGALTSLNISANNLGGYYDDDYEWISDMSSIKALAAAIPKCKALEKLIFGDRPDEVIDDSDADDETDDGEEKEAWTPAVLEVGMNAADLSNKNLGVGGAIIVSAWLSHKDNRAMMSLNISNNEMATKEAGKALADALAGNSVLKELDVSANLDGYNANCTKTDGPGFAQELAIFLSTNGALTSLNL
eukprot:g2202.t1